MNKPRPIKLTLTRTEAAYLLYPVGNGGQQGFHTKLRSQLRNGNLTVEFYDTELGKLIRYMTQYGSGGFQGRLKKAFSRSLMECIAKT